MCVLAFVSPVRSLRPQNQIDRVLRRGQRAGQKADSKRPGGGLPLVEKPFEKARKAVSRSAALGRTARSKMPF
jgi:hypothetical protein